MYPNACHALWPDHAAHIPCGPAMQSCFSCCHVCCHPAPLGAQPALGLQSCLAAFADDACLSASETQVIRNMPTRAFGVRQAQLFQPQCTPQLCTSDPPEEQLSSTLTACPILHGRQLPKHMPIQRLLHGPPHHVANHAPAAACTSGAPRPLTFFGSSWAACFGA